MPALSAVTGAFSVCWRTDFLRRTNSQFVASLLIVSIAGLGLPLPAHAGIVSTDVALASAQRDRIASVLERADVRAQLEAYGVRAADVKARCC